MYPSGPQTFLSRLSPSRIAIGQVQQTIQQKPRVSGSAVNGGNSFGGTIPILNLPSVTQGVKRLPIYTPGSNFTMIFRGKRS